VNSDAPAGRVLDNAVVRYGWADWGEILDPEPWQVNKSGRFGEVPTNLLAKGAKPSQGVIWNWWRQGMMGGAKAHYDGIVAFSQTDFTEDVKRSPCLSS
jgi:hypothetical protein